MADDETMVVTIEPDAPAGGESANPAVTELASQYTEMKTRTARLEDERAAALRRANVAEAAARDARREVETARTETIETQAETVDSGIAAAADAIEAAKKEIRTAIEAGDPGAQTEALGRLTKAQSKLDRLTEAKADIATRKAEAARPAAREEVPASSGDAVEDFIGKHTAPTADWMRAHKEWITDPRKSLKLEAADRDARAQRLAPDSEAYFDHVETFIGLRQAETPAKPAPANGAGPKKPAGRAPVAPVQASN